MNAQYPPKDLGTFWVSLAQRTCAGENLLSSLDAIRVQLHPSPLAVVVQDLIDSVRAGSPLAEAMRRHPAAFGAHVQSLVDGGERAGILDRVLVLIVEAAWRCPECILGKAED